MSLKSIWHERPLHFCFRSIAKHCLPWTCTREKRIRKYWTEKEIESFRRAYRFEQQRSVIPFWDDSGLSERGLWQDTILLSLSLSLLLLKAKKFSFLSRRFRQDLALLLRFHFAQLSKWSLALSLLETFFLFTSIPHPGDETQTPLCKHRVHRSSRDFSSSNSSFFFFRRVTRSSHEIFFTNKFDEIKTSLCSPCFLFVEKNHSSFRG